MFDFLKDDRPRVSTNRRIGGINWICSFENSFPRLVLAAIPTRMPSSRQSIRKIKRPKDLDAIWECRICIVVKLQHCSNTCKIDETVALTMNRRLSTENADSLANNQTLPIATPFSIQQISTVSVHKRCKVANLTGKRDMFCLSRSLFAICPWILIFSFPWTLSGKISRTFQYNSDAECEKTSDNVELHWNGLRTPCELVFQFKSKILKQLKNQKRPSKAIPGVVNGVQVWILVDNWESDLKGVVACINIIALWNLNAWESKFIGRIVTGISISEETWEGSLHQKQNSSNFYKSSFRKIWNKSTPTQYKHKGLPGIDGFSGYRKFS
jgi:hypothetical protein